MIGSDADRHGRTGPGEPNCDAAPPSLSAACHYWSAIYFQSTSLAAHRPSVARLVTLLTFYLPAVAICCLWLLHVLPPLALQKLGPRLLGFGGHPGQGLSNQTLAGLVALCSTKLPRFTRGINPLEWCPRVLRGVTPTSFCCGIVSGLSSFATFETSVEPLSTPLTPTPATTMLAPTDMQEATLSHNEFVLCLRSLLRPFLALSPCEFATCMRALIPSHVTWEGQGLISGQGPSSNSKVLEVQIVELVRHKK